METTPKDSVETKLDNISVEPQVTILQVASPVEYVDDGREIKTVITQRAPALWPVYDNIMDSTTGEIIPGPTGASDINTIPHEKYTVNGKDGFYVEDWMVELIKRPTPS